MPVVLASRPPHTVRLEFAVPRYQVGDRVIVKNWLNPKYNREGTIRAVKPDARADWFTVYSIGYGTPDDCFETQLLPIPPKNYPPPRI